MFFPLVRSILRNFKSSTEYAMRSLLQRHSHLNKSSHEHVLFSWQFRVVTIPMSFSNGPMDIQYLNSRFVHVLLLTCLGLSKSSLNKELIGWV